MGARACARGARGHGDERLREGARGHGDKWVGVAGVRAKVAYESIEYGVLSIGRGIISGGGWQPQVAGGGMMLNSRGDRKPGSWQEKNLLVSGLG